MLSIYKESFKIKKNKTRNENILSSADFVHTKSPYSSNSSEINETLHSIEKRSNQSVSTNITGVVKAALSVILEDSNSRLKDNGTRKLVLVLLAEGMSKEQLSSLIGPAIELKEAGKFHFQ